MGKIVWRMRNLRFPFEHAAGATPLDLNEVNGLIPGYISTQSELNLLEQENILEAKIWASSRIHKNVLTDTFLRDLHTRMFRNVWKWAGKYRKTDKSIGMAWQQVPMELKKLLDDVQFWIEHHTYSWDEVGARLHHRLVLVHPFPNGNGRHARLLTDAVLESYGNKSFSWGAQMAQGSLDKLGSLRSEYILALREADERRYDRLLRFVRS